MRMFAYVSFKPNKNENCFWIIEDYHKSFKGNLVSSFGFVAQR